MIVVDVREACRPARTGKGAWTHGLLTELLRRPLAFMLVTDAPLPDEIVRVLRPEHEVRLLGVRGLAWHRRVARMLRSLPGAAYLSTSSYIVPAFGPAAVRYCTVVHDLIAFRGEPHDRRATVIERLLLGRALRRSSAVLALSGATERDLRGRFPGLRAPVTVVGAGPTATDARWQPPGAQVLCLATLCPRKNQRRLIAAHASLPEELRARHPLVLAGGRGWHDEDIVAAAAATPHVSWRGYVDAAEASRLLSTAAVFAFPSLYEGFGLPVLDALRAGVPVLTSGGGSLAEVAGDAALCVDPESVESIRDGLRRLLERELERRALGARGPAQAAPHTWARTADRVVGALGVDTVA